MNTHAINPQVALSHAADYAYTEDRIERGQSALRNVSLNRMRIQAEDALSKLRLYGRRLHEGGSAMTRITERDHFAGPFRPFRRRFVRWKMLLEDRLVQRWNENYDDYVPEESSGSNSRVRLHVEDATTQPVVT